MDWLRDFSFPKNTELLHTDFGAGAMFWSARRQSIFFRPGYLPTKVHTICKMPISSNDKNKERKKDELTSFLLHRYHRISTLVVATINI
jgi:hypothetical protein